MRVKALQSERVAKATDIDLCSRRGPRERVAVEVTGSRVTRHTYLGRTQEKSGPPSLGLVARARRPTKEKKEFSVSFGPPYNQKALSETLRISSQEEEGRSRFDWDKVSAIIFFIPGILVSNVQTTRQRPRTFKASGCVYWGKYGDGSAS